MGIKNIWTIFTPESKIYDKSSLSGKKIAVDANLFFYQIFYVSDGSVDKFILILIRRLCFAINSQIKLVFVFDGPPSPHKKKVLDERASLREMKTINFLKRTIKAIKKNKNLPVKLLKAPEDFEINILDEDFDDDNNNILFNNKLSSKQIEKVRKQIIEINNSSIHDVTQFSYSQINSRVNSNYKYGPEIIEESDDEENSSGNSSHSDWGDFDSFSIYSENNSSKLIDGTTNNHLKNSIINTKEFTSDLNQKFSDNFNIKTTDDHKTFEIYRNEDSTFYSPDSDLFIKNQEINLKKLKYENIEQTDNLDMKWEKKEDFNMIENYLSQKIKKNELSDIKIEKPLILSEIIDKKLDNKISKFTDLDKNEAQSDLNNLIPSKLFKDSQILPMQIEKKGQDMQIRLKKLLMETKSLGENDSNILSKKLFPGDQLDNEILQSVKDLISFFGIPIVESINESDAQCSQMMNFGIVDMISTEDSDVFLYANPKPNKDFFVIRNLFKKNEPASSYSLKKINEIGISKEGIQFLAHLLGTDYYPGIYGIGPRIALSLLNYINPKKNIKASLIKVKKILTGQIIGPNELSNRLKRISCPPHFPSMTLQNFFENPITKSLDYHLEWKNISFPDIKFWLYSFTSSPKIALELYNEIILLEKNKNSIF